MFIICLKDFFGIRVRGELPLNPPTWLQACSGVGSRGASAHPFGDQFKKWSSWENIRKKLAQIFFEEVRARIPRTPKYLLASASLGWGFDSETRSIACEPNWVNSCCLLPQCEALRTCRSGFSDRSTINNVLSGPEEHAGLNLSRSRQ